MDATKGGRKEESTFMEHAESAVVSPYAGGGGGSTLGHRIATIYLASMLLGTGRQETDGLPVVRLSFQTNPTEHVDDLRVEASNGLDKVVVHIAARRNPNFTRSHPKTAELVKTLLDQVDTFADDERAYVAVAVTAMTPAQREVQHLASLSRDNATEDEFQKQVFQPNRHARLANRYDHLTGLVKKVRPDSSDAELRVLVWLLLNRLWVLNFRVEEDDLTDWVDIGNSLSSLARAGKCGTDVRDALHSGGATQFDLKGTVVDLPLVRRKIHTVLETHSSRSIAAWTQLDLEQKSAMTAVRHNLADGISLPRTHIRSALKSKLINSAEFKEAVFFTGQSGAGKSALTLSTAEEIAASDADFQYVVLNLRRIPNSVATLSAGLGSSFENILKELSAPRRILIVDAADATLEGQGPLLRELAAAAKAAELGLALVISDIAVKETASYLHGLYTNPSTFEIPLLGDDELRDLRVQLPSIAGALRNPPAKSLYRRLSIIDLLARSGSSVTEPLDNWECLELIWQNLFLRADARSSPAARRATILAMSEVELKLPETHRNNSHTNYIALDALRADFLVAPEDLRQSRVEFAHDEVRRFATAVRLVQAESIAEVLNVSGPMRWTLAAAKLACEGRLAGADDPHTEFATLVKKFNILGSGSSVRWKDVPFEALLERPIAYELLRHFLNANTALAKSTLAMFVRIVSLYQRHDGMIDVSRGEPVVRLLVEESNELWHNEDEPFQLVRDWLHSALLVKLPAGNQTRIALRERLLDHWRNHHQSAGVTESSKAPSERTAFNIFSGATKLRRPRRNIPWQITRERYIELIALLGPDINDQVKSCLAIVAAQSPSSLQPAVDPGWSAWSLASYDPKFLLQLTETYFIDKEPNDGRLLWNGVRDHSRRGYGRFSHHEYGPFWVLIQKCPPADWIPVVNRILNHAAYIHCRFEPSSDSDLSSSNFRLAVDGTERTYIGDSGVWSWYRGNASGPNPCMSALQAIERWIDTKIAGGVALEAISAMLMKGCENIAMLGLIFGATIRHLGEDTTILDRYLVEPIVWEYEHYRATQERIGFQLVSSDNITNSDRRKWYLPEIALSLSLGGDRIRRVELKTMLEQLITNAEHFSADESTLQRWAAALDADNLTAEPIEGGICISVEEPKADADELAQIRADLARGNALVVIHNKYWIHPQQQPPGWTIPTPAEIATDLAFVKDLIEYPPPASAVDPYVVAAYVSAAAVRNASAGYPEAFGQLEIFAINSVLEAFKDDTGTTADFSKGPDFEYDFGARGEAAAVLSHLVLPELAKQLTSAGATMNDVATASAVLGSLASTQTSLMFARGLDRIWEHICLDSTCIHPTAYHWAVNLIQLCEVDDSDEDEQPDIVQVDTYTNILVHIPTIPPERLNTSCLSATIRAIGRAATSYSCVAEDAQRDLEILLRAQARGIAAQELSEQHYFVDDHGAETTTAARALLHNLRNLSADDNFLYEYLTLLAPASHAMSALLRDIAQVGSETQELADAASKLWPFLFDHILGLLDTGQVSYDPTDTFSDYALSFLLPNHPEASNSLHNELGLHTFQWINIDELLAAIPRWLQHAAGGRSCLFALLRLLRKLPIDRQLGDGLGWLNTLCLSRADRQLASYDLLNEWLEEVKPAAEALGYGGDWLNLVDQLVYAGNTKLAPYSR